MTTGFLETPAQWMALFAFGMLRMAVLLMFCPFGPTGQGSTQLRVVVAGALSLTCLPMGDPALLEGALQPIRFCALMLKEVVVGAVIGFMLAVPLWIAEGVGALLDNHRGAQTGSQFNVLSSSPSALAGWMQLIAVLLLYQTGGVRWIIDVFATSMALWPPTNLIPQAVPLEIADLVNAFNAMAKGMLVYYLPLFTALVIVEAALSIVSLYASNLQVFQLAMPIKSAVGLLLLLAMSSLIWQTWSTYLMDWIGTWLKALTHV